DNILVKLFISEIVHTEDSFLLKLYYKFNFATEPDNDYLINQKVFDAFYKALKGKQVLVYFGLFKDARKKLKNGELDYLKEVDPTEYIYQIFYTWNKKEYLASEIFDLTESEEQEINHQMIDEIEEEK
ncbi:MAG: hypothetical protein E6979_14075, partial [Staphylococcus aureus]|nr:hypothetical protein [Staphylococcus aureus]MDU1460630.1 hypothetical protein [Staphylococcus epidermidis]MDU2991838.1 hypothetical protein [Streptococcus mitis]MDU5239830.1 hypothetical protein [Haemophilus parainfluenzae]MDU2519485.1 hypothetical protein [Staphylococcus epidermidis]